MTVVLEGVVGRKLLMRTWCMQPFPCTYEQLQVIQRTQYQPTVHRIISLPLDKHYAGQVQVSAYGYVICTYIVASVIGGKLISKMVG